MSIKPLYIKQTCEDGPLCCAGGSSEIVRQWKLKNFNTQFFLRKVYRELVAGNIYDADVDRGHTTIKKVKWPGYFLSKLPVEKFLSEIQDPEILADVKRRMKYVEN